MSAELYETIQPTDHKDSVLYMMLRRLINGEYAEQQVDFNAAGLQAGEQVLQRPFTPEDVVVDIGSNTGQVAAEAALATGISAHMVCIEPDPEAIEAHSLIPDHLWRRISLLQAKGEALPLADNSASGAGLHNVIFRAQDARAVLTEVERVVEPGGFVVISSNAQGHALYRHTFEQRVAQHVIRESGVNFSVPRPPAEGFYLEDLPERIKAVGGLKIIDELYISQDTQAVITRGQRLDDYLTSIKYSAANTNIPPHLRALWRRIVDTLVAPCIEDSIRNMEIDDRKKGVVREPFFADTIRRGMFVLVNTKTG